MRCLAIETATGTVGVALASGSGEPVAVTLAAERHHVELLHPAIEKACAEAGVALSEIDGVGVDVGPGLFTGIRVGVAAAKGIALALGLPAVGVTSLAVLAHACEARATDAGAAAVPVVDLRRGEVAWQGPAGISWGKPEDLVAELAGAGWQTSRVLFAGDGAIRYASFLEGSAEAPGTWSVAGEELAFPPVGSLARLATLALDAGKGVDAAHLEPCYLREADARINWTTRHDGPLGGGA